MDLTKINLIRSIKQLFRSKENYVSDLTPKGVAKTIASPDHGKPGHSAKVWNHIYSKIENNKRNK